MSRVLEVQSGIRSGQNLLRESGEEIKRELDWGFGQLQTED